MSTPTLGRDQLEALCGSSRWVELVQMRGPFASHDALREAADEAFDQLHRDDWLEAFAHHPRIGDVESLRERFAASGALSEREQAGMAGAGEDVVQALADGNVEYERRFGFVFLIRAAGRTAEQILSVLQMRIDNEPELELMIAAGQQREITHLRIDALNLGGD